MTTPTLTSIQIQLEFLTGEVQAIKKMTEDLARCQLETQRRMVAYNGHIEEAERAKGKASVWEGRVWEVTKTGLAVAIGIVITRLLGG